MKKIFLLFTFALTVSEGFAQVRMRDVFAELPDSVFPLMTRNNRLDCIDFIENNMEARVKNKFDEPVMLDTLTADYLLIHTSKKSYVEMKFVSHGSDTLICVNRTYLGPVEDSEVRLYNMDWKYLRTVSRPETKEFFKSKDQISPWKPEMADTMRMVRAEAEFLPLIKAKLSPEADGICWMLQTKEFSKGIKKVADKYLQPVVSKL